MSYHKDQFKELSQDDLLMKSIPYVQDDMWTMPNSVVSTRFDFKGFDFTVAPSTTPRHNLIFARSIPILAVFKGIPDNMSDTIPLLLMHKTSGFILYEWDTIATAERLVNEGKLSLLMVGGLAP